tara:strand:- start:3 stop:251 length:249 start_codon:yes stop_codon:yes gene_type:complete
MPYLFSLFKEIINKPVPNTGNIDKKFGYGSSLLISINAVMIIQKPSSESSPFNLLDLINNSLLKSSRAIREPNNICQNLEKK